MTEYEIKFENLSCFDKSLDNDPDEKIRLFLKGLKPFIREKVYHLNHNSVADAVKTTMKVEQERVDASRFLDKKHNGDGKKLGNPGKKYKSDSGSSGASSGKSWFSGSSNESRESKERVCFGCGKPGHFKRECPTLNRDQRSYQSPNTQAQSQVSSRPGGSGQSYSFNQGRGQSQSGPRGGGNLVARGGGRTPGRVYSLTRAEQPEAKVMEGTILFFSSWVKVLFDTGASNSFISSTLVDTLELNVESLEIPLCVDTPVGGKVRLGSICRNCSLSIG